MASLEVVTTTLAAWYELYPTRELTPNTAAVWQEVFAQVPDAEFSAAARRVAADPTRHFFPTAGELSAALKANGPPPPNATELLADIRKLGYMDPQFQWRLPSVDTVRQKFGDGIASAYGSVGPHRLNADSETTRDIALRDFAQALSHELREGRLDAPRSLPEPRRAPKSLGDGQ